MTTHRSMLLFPMVGAALLASCTNQTSDPPPQCSGDFGTSIEASRVEAFLDASAVFHGAVLDTEADLLATCEDMGAALGMTEAEIFLGTTSREGTLGLETACANVEARIDAELTAIRAAGVIVVTIDARPPVCDLSVDAYVSCVADCDAVVDPGSLEVMCEGGELRGQCDAECTGSCAVDVDVACEGRCEGICDGTCSAYGPDRECKGSCDGVCHGQCVVDTAASCQGECRGSCSVRFTEPRCTGDVRAPMASVDCDAYCDAHAASMVTCTEGEVHLTIEGSITPDLRARADRLIAAFEVGASGIIALRGRVAFLATSGVILVSAGARVDAGAVGSAAVLCATGAALDTVDAASRLSASVEVSVNVSATVEASAD